MSSLPVSMKRIGWKQPGTSGNIDILDAQGQVTLWSVVLSGRISNSSKLLCMPSMKRIRSKTGEKKWQQHFPHYKSMAIFSGAKGQLTPQLVVGSRRISRSNELSCTALCYLQV